MFLHRVMELTAGGIFLIIVLLRVKQLIKFGKTRLVRPDAGQGALFIIRILIVPGLQRRICFRIDPVIFHLFQGGSGVDFLP